LTNFVQLSYWDKSVQLCEITSEFQIGCDFEFYWSYFFC